MTARIPFGHGVQHLQSDLRLASLVERDGRMNCSASVEGI